MYKGTKTSHDERTGKYGVYFHCDKQIIFILPNDPDIRRLQLMHVNTHVQA